MSDAHLFASRPIIRALHESPLKRAIAFLARERHYDLAITRFAPRGPGEQYPPSVHRDRHWICHILEGKGALWVREGGLPTRVFLRPGSLITFLAGTPHDFAAVGEPLVVLSVGVNLR